MQLTLNEKMKENRRECYQAMLDIGVDNPHPGWRAMYAVFSMLYDIFVWIVEKKYLQ